MSTETPINRLSEMITRLQILFDNLEKTACYLDDQISDLFGAVPHLFVKPIEKVDPQMPECFEEEFNRRIDECIEKVNEIKWHIERFNSPIPQPISRSE